MKYESQYYGVVSLGDSISHHGIKGQKWGIRRFQNEDGSYTEAGKANRKSDYRRELRARQKERRKARREETAAFKKELRQRKKQRRDAAWEAQRDFNRRTRKQRLAQYGIIAGIVVANALSQRLTQKQTMESLRRDIQETARVDQMISNSKRKLRSKAIKDARSFSRFTQDMGNMTMDDLRRLDLY